MLSHQLVKQYIPRYDNADLPTVLQMLLLSLLTKSLPNQLACLHIYSYIINTKKIPFIHNHCGCHNAIHLMTLIIFILSFESQTWRNDNIKYLQYLIFLSLYISISIYLQPCCFPPLLLFKKKADYTVKSSAGIRSKSDALHRLCQS